VSPNRALRGPDIESDHLLKIYFKVKLRVKTEKKYNEKRKIVNIFKNSKWKEEFTIELNNIINSKYWKIWKIKIIWKITLMKNGKTLKQ